jgi:2-polyprenyl-3-methyl-5-hydroxy-6-metoxy-1,4-benzoquinol methylase
MPPTPPESTREASYAQRLQRLSQRGGAIRKIVDPQRPYRWNLRRLQPGFVLDIGCGIGRNLEHLDGHGVGVDHNPACISACVGKGLTAYLPHEFLASEFAIERRFDSILVAHVVEHMTEVEAQALLTPYLAYLRQGGRVIVITPQERGQASDATHVRFIDHAALSQLAVSLALSVVSVRSFPLPRAFGRWFTYNESVSILS